MLPHGLDPAAGHAVDAYLLWDLWSSFGRQAWRHAGLPVQAGRATVPLLVELVGPAAKAPSALMDIAREADVATGCRALADALAQSLAAWPLSRFHTALVDRDAVLPALAAATRGGVLQRWQLGAAGAAARAMPLAKPSAVHDPRRSACTLGIVDDGCCLAHALYRTPVPHSRFAWVWDQDPASPASKPWLRAPAPSNAGVALVRYGAELARPQIEAVLDAHPGLGETAEQALYAALGRRHWGTPGHTHGARVTHLMAGPAAPGQRDGDVADEADIVFVQLPHGSLADTSGQSIPMQVLDGARYIVARAGLAPVAGARPVRKAKDEPPVATLCLSLGGTAGPHDGSSMVEQALDELAVLPGVRVVVAAGNLPAPRRADPARWLHAQRSVKQGQTGRFLVHVSAANPRHAFVELWIPGHVDGIELANFSVQVQAPGLPPCNAVRCGQAQLLHMAQDGGMPVAGLLFPRQVAQGLNGSLILLAIGATAADLADAAGRPGAPDGLWVLTVQSTAVQAVTVHAWVERDDGFVPPRRPQQTWFERDGDDPPTQPGVNDDCTLSSLAAGRHVVVAAGYSQASGAPLDDRRRARRRVHGNATAAVAHDLAPTDRGDARPGLLVPGFFSGQMTTMRGSSAAAPQVGRWIARGRPSSAPNPEPNPKDGDSSGEQASTPVAPVREVPAR